MSVDWGPFGGHPNSMAMYVHRQLLRRYSLIQFEATCLENSKGTKAGLKPLAYLCGRGETLVERTMRDNYCHVPLINSNLLAVVLLSSFVLILNSSHSPLKTFNTSFRGCPHSEFSCHRKRHAPANQPRESAWQKMELGGRNGTKSWSGPEIREDFGGQICCPVICPFAADLFDLPLAVNTYHLLEILSHFF